MSGFVVKSGVAQSHIQKSNQALESNQFTGPEIGPGALCMQGQCSNIEHEDRLNFTCALPLEQNSLEQDLLSRSIF